MSGHAANCVERYLELANIDRTKLKRVNTPCLDEHALTDSDYEARGDLADVAAKIVLKVLYLAHVTRPDLLWTVNSLAREVTKWTRASDKRLFRLICYLESSKNFVQFCFVGDDFGDLSLAIVLRCFILRRRP